MRREKTHLTPYLANIIVITYSSNNYERITGKMQLSPYDGWGINTQL